MRIVIAGGSGLLGGALAARMATAGHEAVVLTRRPAPSTVPGVRHVGWVPDGSLGPWAREIGETDVIVNLSGASIADRRWTTRRKAELRSSRIDSTAGLVAAVHAASRRPATFVQGSAVGYYGARDDDRTFDEQSAPGNDFLADLAVDWEDAAKPVAALGCRLVTVRTAVVLARDDGALPPMARPFRFFAGGPVGSGRQYISWIAIDDWVALVEWAIATTTISGAINASAPAPVTNAEFSAAIGRALRRPSWLPAPAFALRAMFGELATALLLRGQRVVPARAVSLGFTFRYESIDDALGRILAR